MSRLVPSPFNGRGRDNRQFLLDPGQNHSENLVPNRIASPSEQPCNADVSRKVGHEAFYIQKRRIFPYDEKQTVTEEPTNADRDQSNGEKLPDGLDAV